MKHPGRYLPFIVAAVLMVLFYPEQNRFGYEYSEGDQWSYETLVADMDFPILKTPDQLFREKEEKSSSVIDCYLYDEQVLSAVMGILESSPAMKSLSAAGASELMADLKTYYEAGVVSSFETGQDGVSDVILVKRGKRVGELPVSNVYTVQDVLDLVVERIGGEVQEDEFQDFVTKSGLDYAIRPNLVYDEATTSLFHKEAVDYISPTRGMVYSGQLIVSEGELISPDVKQMLDSYKAEYENVYGGSLPSWKYFLSHTALIVIFLSLVFVMLYVGDRAVLDDVRKLSLVLTLFLISYLATILGTRADVKWLFIFPYASLMIYALSFFKNHTAMTLYILMMIPLLFVRDCGLTLFFCNLCAGFALVLTYNWLGRGWIQFLNVIFVFAAMAVVLVCSSLSSAFSEWTELRRGFSYIALNSILVVVCFPFMFLLEKIFSQLSFSHLWFLSDTNSKLLSKLSKVAPGTFQHSLQVSNLAEHAVREIGGNSMLVKVAALYHDIGKIENPLCFIENKPAGSDDEYHSRLTAEESAGEIIRHVKAGMEIAAKESLPEPITAFIRSHHGSTRTGYFYTKYCNEGGDASNVAPFTYPYGLPQTREEAVLMMADAIEAASRTLKSYSPESISELVDRIVSEKVNGHQFDSADITLKEIIRVRESFKSYLQQIYHARISYPRREVQS